jgi:mannobiose 2-epimerase
MTIIADTKNWWAQAEGLNTLLIMDKYYPNDPHHYFDRFKHLWTYVQTYLIDPVNGDWYQGGIDKQPEYKTALKDQIWKGTYHNFRALMNCVQSLQPDDLPPAAPVNLKVKKVGHSNIITWYSAKGNKSFIGYNIYAGGKRVWYTALTTFEVPAALKGKTLKISAVNMHGNESKFSAGVAL